MWAGRVGRVSIQVSFFAELPRTYMCIGIFLYRIGENIQVYWHLSLLNCREYTSVSASFSAELLKTCLTWQSNIILYVQSHEPDTYWTGMHVEKKSKANYIIHTHCVRVFQPPRADPKLKLQGDNCLLVHSLCALHCFAGFAWKVLSARTCFHRKSL